MLHALDGLAHVLMLLNAHKNVHMVRPGKTCNDILFMFPHTLDQVRDHTDIQRPVSLARENTGCRLFCHSANTHFRSLFKTYGDKLRGNDGASRTAAPLLNHVARLGVG